MRKSKPSPSLQMVAERAGVSIATVSRVVNGNPGRISASTVAMVQEVAQALDYRPQSVGRTLRTGESRLIGVLASDLSNPLMGAIVGSIERMLRREGFTMILCDTHEQADLQDEHLRQLEAQSAQAVILVVAVPSVRLEAARARRWPLIFVNRRDPGPTQPTQTWPYIGMDHFRAGRDLALACRRRGLARPAVVYASLAHSTARQRLAGFLAGWGEAAAPHAAIQLGGFHDDHLENGYRAAAALFDSDAKADIVVALSDLIAYGVYRRAFEAGLGVPADIEIASLDDGPLNAWVAPWLNAVRFSFDAVGEAAVEILRGLLQGEASGDRILAHEIVLSPADRRRPSPGAAPA